VIKDRCLRRTCALIKAKKRRRIRNKSYKKAIKALKPSCDTDKVKAATI
jgi:hypothetical protein